MAAAIRSTTKNQMCSMCSPQQVTAITSCEGCSKKLCRKHFNEHRDILSKDFQNVFDRHDSLLQDLQLKINSASKPTDNAKARAILTEIDEWEKTTIKRVSQTANTARITLESLFNRKSEFDQFKQKFDRITEELKERQESESFLETHIDHWIKRLEQLKIETHQPSTIEINPPVLQIQNIDWHTVIKLCSPLDQPKDKPKLIRDPILCAMKLYFPISCSNHSTNKY